MNIRRGEKEDMPAVLNLIKELAAFEKEPEAVIVTLLAKPEPLVNETS